jgi:diguanylate cyclase (GGDEF)-like protein
MIFKLTKALAICFSYSLLIISSNSSANTILTEFEDFIALNPISDSLKKLDQFDLSSSAFSLEEQAKFYFLYGQVYEKNRQLDLAISSYDKGITLVKALPVTDVLIDSYLERSFAVYLQTNDPDTYCVDRKKALHFARLHNNSELLAKTLTQNAFCYDDAATAHIGIKLLDEAMSAVDKGEGLNINRKALIYNATGTLYRAIGLHQRGYENFEKAYLTWSQIDDKQDMFNMQYNMFSEAIMLGDWKKAQANVDAQFDLAKNATEFEDFYFFSHLNAGVVALRTHDYPQAIINLEQAISLKDTTSERYFVSSSYLYLALAYFRSNNPEKAAEMARFFKQDNTFRADKIEMILKADAIIAFDVHDDLNAMNLLLNVIDEMRKENIQIVNNKSIRSALEHNVKLAEFENELLANQLAINELQLAATQDKKRIDTLKLSLFVLLLLTAIVFLLNHLKILKKQAQTDFLTGISNRRYTFNKGADLVDCAIKNKRPISVIMFDIDNFKAINDTHGHHIGDLTIKALTKRATGCIKVKDLIGRIGGEEFVIVLPNTNEQDAFIVSERLRKSIEQQSFLFGDLSINFTISLGVAMLQDDTMSFASLVNNADSALYRAKNAGKNRVFMALNKGERRHLDAPVIESSEYRLHLDTES